MISKQWFKDTMQGINYESLVWELIHSNKMNPWCQFRLNEIRWTACYVKTPVTKKEYILHINEIYPTIKVRNKIISKYRDNLIRVKVNPAMEKLFWITYK